MADETQTQNPGWHDLLGEFHPVNADDYESVKHARINSSREDLLGEITGLIIEYANAHELLGEIYREQEAEDRMYKPEMLDELVAILNQGLDDEPEDDDPTCIECGWHRSEHGHQDHGFQRRLTDEEYAAEQQGFAMQWEMENGSYIDGLNHDDDPDDDEVNQDDPAEFTAADAEYAAEHCIPYAEHVR